MGAAFAKIDSERYRETISKLKKNSISALRTLCHQYEEQKIVTCPMIQKHLDLDIKQAVLSFMCRYENIE